VQSETAATEKCPYAHDMQTNLVKAALMGIWVLAVGAFSYASGTTSLATWTLLVLVSLAPPVVMGRLWSAPPATMPETIRKALR
jgi:hypothetical protein